MLALDPLKEFQDEGCKGRSSWSPQLDLEPRHLDFLDFVDFGVLSAQLQLLASNEDLEKTHVHVHFQQHMFTKFYAT